MTTLCTHEAAGRAWPRAGAQAASRAAGWRVATPLLLAGFALTVHAVPGAAAALEWKRALPVGWTMLTSHFVHASVDHLLWDVAVFAVLGVMLALRSMRSFALALLAAMVAVSVVVWLWCPEFESYRGLSGLDSALFGALWAHEFKETTARLRHGERGLHWWLAAVVAAGVGFVGKTVFECWTGTTLFVQSAEAGMTPVPAAHVVGLLCGVGAAMWCGGRGARAARVAVAA